jgi:hypothetical protein
MASLVTSIRLAWAFAGRTPTIGRGRWCVTWTLYANQGDFLPHDQCPMAVVIQTRHAVRGATAVAERPNGTRINFMPFPTPVFGDHGAILSAAIMLINISTGDESALRKLCEDSRVWQTGIVAQSLAAFSIEDIRKLLRELDRELGRRAQPTRH